LEEEQLSQQQAAGFYGISTDGDADGSLRIEELIQTSYQQW
jgi:hypothetical protein